MGYVYFTEEQKERANTVDLKDFLERQGERLLRSGPEWRMSSDHSTLPFLLYRHQLLYCLPFLVYGGFSVWGRPYY